MLYVLGKSSSSIFPYLVTDIFIFFFFFFANLSKSNNSGLLFKIPIGDDFDDLILDLLRIADLFLDFFFNSILLLSMKMSVELC